MSLGDSKTQARPWVAALAVPLTAMTGTPWQAYNGGVGGSTVWSYLPLADGILAAFPADASPGDYKVVTLNWGANDVGSLPAEATWEADYLAIIDKVHAKAPNAKVYLMRPWRRGYDAECATLHGWIDTIVAARAFTYVGPDEAVWMKGADDGATMTVDGVHYSAAGTTEAAAQWLAVIP